MGSIEFTYPEDLVVLCKSRWLGFQVRMGRRTSPTPDPSKKNQDSPALVASDDKEPPFPSDVHLRMLLDVAYHVSFLTDERRSVAVRLIYVLPQTFELQNSGFNINGIRPKKFESTMPLTVANLLKLAPAVQATECAIAVGPFKDASNESESELTIWGILDLGTNWHELLMGAESGSMCPPNLLTISSFAPGALTASTLGMVLLRLRNGSLVGMPLPSLSEGHIGAFVQKGADDLYDSVIKKAGIKKFAKKPDSDEHPRHVYRRALTHIMNLVRDDHHGGTLLLIPDEIAPGDTRLTDRVAIKYGLKEVSVWDDLISESVANREHYGLLFPRDNVFGTKRSHASAVAKLKDQISWELRHSGAKRRIAAFCRFVAGLAAVDGAVVLTRRLSVLGFGAEFLAPSPSLVSIRQAADPDGKKYVDVPISTFGTRHRSAMRMCSSLEDCACFVISQDGPVKAIKRIGAFVYSWSDVGLGRETL